jgi:RecA-family ATPase
MPILKEQSPRPEDRNEAGGSPGRVPDRLRQLAATLEGNDSLNTVRLVEMLAEELKGAEPLPEPQLLADVTEEDLKPPPVLIHGALYQGGKLLLSGASKARKTWLLMDLVLALASGGDWLGMRTNRTRVLLIDCELLPFEPKKRLKLIADARNVWDHSGIFLQTLRGRRLTLEKLKASILLFCKKHEIGAIAIDPLYRVMEGRDENANGEIADFLCGIEEIAHEAGAAVLLSHHFAKGNAAGKNSIDRMSGAGTFARDPDCLVSLTEAEASTEDTPAHIVEFSIRSFKPIKPFGIRWEFPLFNRDDDMSTKLKDARGRPKEGDDAGDLVRLLKEHLELQATEFKQLANEEFGITRTRFHDALKQIKERPDLRTRTEGKKKFYSLAVEAEKENRSGPIQATIEAV